MTFDAADILLNVLYRVLALGGAWLSAAMLAWSVWRLRRPQPLALLAPLVAITGAVASVVLYLWIGGVSVEWTAVAVLVVAGAALGQAALLLVRTERRAGRLWVARSQWFLLLWGGALVAAQVGGALDARTAFAVGVAASIAASAMVVSVNAGLVYRRFRIA